MFYPHYLFHNTGGQWFASSVYGEGSGSVLIGGLYCTGDEGSLLQCNRDTFVTVTDCNHGLDIGIKCEGDHLLLYVII